MPRWTRRSCLSTLAASLPCLSILSEHRASRTSCETLSPAMSATIIAEIPAGVADDLDLREGDGVLWTGDK